MSLDLSKRFSTELGRFLTAEEILAAAFAAAKDAIRVELSTPNGTSAKPSVTRPNNATPYTAGDVIGIDAGTAQVETATAAGTITPGTAQVETATVVGTIAGTKQVETATVVGTIIAGTAQVETATAVGTITGSGNAEVIVTGALFPGSPITLNVPVTNTDTAATWAGKVRAALQTIDAITDYYTVGGAGAAITLTKLTPAANDATLNISLNNGTCTGITPALTSANTTAGVAPGTGNALVTITGAGIIGTPLAVNIAVAASDDASAVAGKIRTALGLLAAVTTNYAVGGAGATVSLTALNYAPNDATLNIAVDNGTCVGLTPAPTSANTTAGVDTGAGNAVVIITSALLPGGKTYMVAVAAEDNASAVAGKIRTALNAQAAITALFTVGGAGANVSLTALTAAANDATLKINIDNSSCVGLTPAPTSANTTAGVAPGTGNALVTVTGAGITGSPLAVNVPVVAGDTAATWAGKVRTALSALSAITSLYTVGGAGTSITLTKIVPAANDATLNIALDNGTCTGITPAASSANTTAGSITTGNAGSAIIEFTNMGQAGGHIIITGVDLRIDLNAIPAGMTSFRLRLYDAAPDAILDNAAWDLSSAGDRSKYLGYVDIPLIVDEGGTLHVQSDQINKKVKLADGSTSLFGLLVTNGGYTPAASTVYTPRLHAVAA
jgi:hypothetical protein